MWEPCLLGCLRVLGGFQPKQTITRVYCLGIILRRRLKMIWIASREEKNERGNVRTKSTFSFTATFSSFLCYLYSLCSPYTSSAFLSSNTSWEEKSGDLLDIWSHLLLDFSLKKDEDTTPLADNELPVLCTSYPSPERTLYHSVDAVSIHLVSGKAEILNA